MARSVFYYHLKHLKTIDKYFNEKESIKLIFHEHKGRYGYRRVTAEMHNRGFMLKRLSQNKFEMASIVSFQIEVICIFFKKRSLQACF